MNAASGKRLVVALLSVCVAVLVAAGGSRAVGAQKPADAKPAAEKKAPARSQGRLPAYFGSVVSAEQREQIYAIQATYAEQIQQLEKQLESLKQKRAAEVEAVLTPEQQAKIKQLRSDAAAKRQDAEKTKAAANDKPAAQ